MSKENKSAGMPAKSLLFFLPLAVTAAAALIGIASLKPVPTELPEKLVYAEPTASPAETAKPDETMGLGAEATEAPSEEPIGTPESATEAPATREPSDIPEAQTPEDTDAPETSAPQSAEPTTAGSTAAPKPTNTPAPTQAPNNTNAPQQTGYPTAAPTTAPTNAPTNAPTAKPTAAPVTAVPTTPPTAPPTETPGKYRDGTYAASARCTDNGMFDYTVEVTVVVSGGDITSFNAVRKDDLSAPGIPDMNAVFMENALGSIRSEILREQSADSIDVVSGATYSSRSIIEAAKTALARASKSVSGIIEPTVLPDRRSHFFKAHSEESEER